MCNVRKLDQTDNSSSRLPVESDQIDFRGVRIVLLRRLRFGSKNFIFTWAAEKQVRLFLFFSRAVVAGVTSPSVDWERARPQFWSNYEAEHFWVSTGTEAARFMSPDCWVASGRSGDVNSALKKIWFWGNWFPGRNSSMTQKAKGMFCWENFFGLD